MRRRPSLSGLRLPARTTLYRYLCRFHRRLFAHRRLRTKRPEATPSNITHQSWQMDFKGEVRAERIGLVKPFVICDAFTSAPLAARLHGIDGEHGALTSEQVQQDLRFEAWGLPD